MNDLPAQSLQIPSTEPGSAGSLLRQWRLQADLDLGVLAGILKVPERQLLALEADDWAQIPGGATVVRALAASVCRQLHRDAAPVLAMLPQADTRWKQPSTRAPAVKVRRRAFGGGAARDGRHLAVLAVVVLLVLALAWLWQSPITLDWATWSDDRNARNEVPAMPPQPGASEPVMVTEVATLNTQTSATAPAQPASAAVNGKPVTGPGSHELVFEAQGESSWIEVRDAQSQVLHSGVLAAGQRQSVSSRGPMTVVVGRPESIRVTHHGKAFDLAPHTQFSVARFEVQP